MFKGSFLLLTVITALTCTGCNNLPTVNISDIKITAGDKITLNKASGGQVLTMKEIPFERSKIAKLLNDGLRNSTFEGTYNSQKNVNITGLMPNYIGINEGKGVTEIRILRYQAYTTSKLKSENFVQAHDLADELVIYMPKHVPVIVKSHVLYSLVSGSGSSGYFESFHE